MKIGWGRQRLCGKRKGLEIEKLREGGTYIQCFSLFMYVEVR
jgi:hypothetical protein